MAYQQLFPLLSHHDGITRATLATSEIQDEVQDIASDIQGHSWTGTYPYHEFDFSKEKNSHSTRGQMSFSWFNLPSS